jgi:hypothetical protein
MTWLEAPRLLLGLVAALVPVAGVWLAIVIAALIRSTVERSTSEESPASFGVDRWVAEPPSEVLSREPRPASAGAETEKEPNPSGGSFALSAVPTGDPSPR